MATQGRLGWPKDSATAPNEELREAALCRCPKLTPLDSNKMPLVFNLLLPFHFLRAGTDWTSKQGLRIDIEDSMGRG